MTALLSSCLHGHESMNSIGFHSVKGVTVKSLWRSTDLKWNFLGRTLAIWILKALVTLEFTLRRGLLSFLRRKSNRLAIVVEEFRILPSVFPLLTYSSRIHLLLIGKFLSLEVSSQVLSIGWTILKIKQPRAALWAYLIHIIAGFIWIHQNLSLQYFLLKTWASPFSFENYILTLTHLKIADLEFGALELAIIIFTVESLFFKLKIFVVIGSLAKDLIFRLLRWLNLFGVFTTWTHSLYNYLR